MPTSSTDILTTQDHLLDGRVHLVQPARGFRVGIDTVLLAASVPAEPFGTVLDIGCGVGGALLCVAVRCPGHRLLGVEIQPDYAGLARQNVNLHGFDDRIDIINSNILDKEILDAHSVDHVMLNPPYFPEDATPTTCTGRDIANRQQGDLAEWFRVIRRVTRPGGTISMIYPASGITDIMSWMAKGMGGMKILPVHARVDAPAMRVLVRAIVGSKAAPEILPGLVIHDVTGSYTSGAERILRQMEAVVW